MKVVLRCACQLPTVDVDPTKISNGDRKLVRKVVVDRGKCRWVLRASCTIRTWCGDKSSIYLKSWLVERR
jgi:hypothetical protein